MYFSLSTHLVDYYLHFLDPLVQLLLFCFFCFGWIGTFTLKGWRDLIEVQDICIYYMQSFMQIYIEHRLFYLCGFSILGICPEPSDYECFCTNSW